MSLIVFFLNVIDPISNVQDILQFMLVVNLLRYFVFAGLAFLLFYVLFKKKWQSKKIQLRFPKSKDYQREILYSIGTCLIFVAIGWLVFFSPLREFNLKYDHIADYGWGYWAFSIIAMIFMHDTYFYWSHRLMHQPKLFKYLHLVHHKSTNPSPWAAYAFHPYEAVVEAGIIIPIAFIIPFHQTAIIVFLLIMIIYNVYGHLGYEIFPKKFHKNFIGKWINTSVNHNQHHKHFNGNYGLYFLFWDRWMGTLRSDYDEAYEKVSLQRKATINT